MNIIYPRLTPKLLETIIKMTELAEHHPDWLDDAGCPYDPEAGATLRKAFAPRIVEVEVTAPNAHRRDIAAKAAEGAGQIGRKKKETVVVDEVANEIADIKNELKQLKLDAKALQTADKISIIKTRAMLVEKLLTMAERVYNVKKMSHFQSTIMGVLDDLVPADGQQEFMRRIEPFANE